MKENYDQSMCIDSQSNKSNTEVNYCTLSLLLRCTWMTLPMLILALSKFIKS